MGYSRSRDAGLLKLTSDQIQYGGRPSNFRSSNRCKSDAHCSVSLKFGMEFDHMRADKHQMFKVKRSKVNVSA